MSTVCGNLKKGNNETGSIPTLSNPIISNKRRSIKEKLHLYIVPA
jgi:hypothetical protein